jgi:uncharacterized membrane protein YuzA (DUF378 family)
MEQETMAKELFGYFTGLFLIVVAILNWEWFFNIWNAQLAIKLFGRNGARIFYILAGIFIIFLAHVEAVHRIKV